MNKGSGGAVDAGAEAGSDVAPMASGWPRLDGKQPFLPMNDENRRLLLRRLEDLVILQRLTEMVRFSQQHGVQSGGEGAFIGVTGSASDSQLGVCLAAESLWVVDVLLEPIAERFAFHFHGALPPPPRLSSRPVRHHGV